MANLASAQITDKKINQYNIDMLNTLGNLHDSFKDSLALYTLNAVAIVNNENDYSVEIQSSDSLTFNKIKGLKEYMANYDYKQLLGKNRSVTFVLPISITVWGSKYEEKKLPAYLNNQIAALFYNKFESDNSPTIYLKPLIMSIDMKVYD